MPSRIDWHAGERAAHKLLKAPTPSHNPTSPGLPRPYAQRIAASPLVAFGTLDRDGRPWTTLWGGERGFARPVAPGMLGVNATVGGDDPVFGELWRGAGADGFVRPDGGEESLKILGGLSIDPETRDRVKFAGRRLAGAVVAKEGEGVEVDDEDEAGGRGKAGMEVQMIVEVTETLGNCPKYINKKRIVPTEMKPVVASKGLPLSEEAIRLIRKADLFFISSATVVNGEVSMDTNHRGGPPGFVRVARNDEGGVVLVYPEYSGNRLYQSLGNMMVNPKAGLVIPDFETGDTLYVTGETSIITGQQASEMLARTKIAIQITVTSALFIKSSLPFRGVTVDYSPYNPPVRQLLSEKTPLLPSGAETAGITAKFVGREKITPTISRITFSLDKGASDKILPWKAGQAVTLDFAPELDMGWEHMNDEAPESLNDDYIRTFTISNDPPEAGEGGVESGTKIQITMRKHGPATSLLWIANPRADLTIPVLGFGGEDKALLPRHKTHVKAVFIAGGVGITPLLAQANGVLSADNSLRVLWSLRGEDLPLAADTFATIPGLASRTRIFVTGSEVPGQSKIQEQLRATGAQISNGRLLQEDVSVEKGPGRKFFVCAGDKLMKLVLGWLDGDDVVFESFSY